MFTDSHLHRRLLLNYVDKVNNSRLDKELALQTGKFVFTAWLHMERTIPRAIHPKLLLPSESLKFGQLNLNVVAYPLTKTHVKDG